MEHLHIQRALDVEGTISFPVGESITSLLYLAGIVVAGLYQLYLLKRDAEASRRTAHGRNTGPEQHQTLTWESNVYSIPNV